MAILMESVRAHQMQHNMYTYKLIACKKTAPYVYATKFKTNNLNDQASFTVFAVVMTQAQTHLLCTYR